MPTKTFRFNDEIARAKDSITVWKCLEGLSRALEGHRLFTVMTVDMDKNVARRVYSSHPQEYPVTGTKPIVQNSWFDIVHGEKRSFVANTITAIARVFPDYELIKSMGCGSVINLPVVLGDELVATINLLHVEKHYTAKLVRTLEKELSVPAKLCCSLALQFDQSHG